MDSYIGKYRVIRSLGEGGSASVYLCADDRLGTLWAIRAVKRRGGEVRRGFQLLKELDHPALPRIVEELRSGDVLYEVMDYVRGRTLRELLNDEAPLSLAAAMQLALEITEIFCYLAEREPPVIYRDLKPENLMVTEDGHIKLIDFELACLGEQKNCLPVGTRGYAAPEQYLGRAGVRSDLYAVGRTLLDVFEKAGRSLGRSSFSQRALLKKAVSAAERAASPLEEKRPSGPSELREELVRLETRRRLLRPAGRAAAVLLLAFLLAGLGAAVVREARLLERNSMKAEYLAEAGEILADAAACLAEQDGRGHVPAQAEPLSERAEAAAETGESLSAVLEGDSQVIRAAGECWLYAGLLSGEEERRRSLLRKALLIDFKRMDGLQDGELIALLLRDAEISDLLGDESGAELCRRRAALLAGQTEEPPERREG